MTEITEQLRARLLERARTMHFGERNPEPGISVAAFGQALKEGSTVEAREALEPVLKDLVLKLDLN